MKTKLVSVLSLTALLAVPQVVSAQGGAVEKNIRPLEGNRRVEEWWLESWRDGWEYRVESKFSFSSKSKVKPGELEHVEGLRERVAQKLKTAVNSVTAQQIGIIELQIKGTVVAQNTVLQKDAEMLRIGRSYNRVDTTREILREKVEGVSFDLAEKLFEKKWIDGGVNAIKWALRGLAALVTLKMPPAGPVVAPMSETLPNYIGKKATDRVDQIFKDNGLGRNKEGVITIDPDGKFAKDKLPPRVNDLMNLALKLTDEFRDRIVFLSASNTKGNLLEARDVQDPNVIVKFVVAPPTDKEAARKELHAAIDASPKVSDIVYGTLQRESFILTRELFNYEERKPGDRWVVDAKLFDSLLHPDLRGSFKGRAIMEYAADTVMRDPANNTRYPARVLKLTFSGRVNGANLISDFEYTEKGGDGFSAKFDPETVSEFYIDKNGNYLRQATISLRSSDSSKLPDMVLAKGLEAAGRSSMDVEYFCHGTPIE